MFEHRKSSPNHSGESVTRDTAGKSCCNARIEVSKSLSPDGLWIFGDDFLPEFVISNACVANPYIPPFSKCMALVRPASVLRSERA